MKAFSGDGVDGGVGGVESFVASEDGWVQDAKWRRRRVVWVSWGGGEEELDVTAL